MQPRLSWTESPPVCLRQAGFPVCLFELFSLSLEEPGAVMSLYKQREGWGRKLHWRGPGRGGGWGWAREVFKGGGVWSAWEQRETPGSIKKPNGTASH